ncbi:MAG: cysteine desulfurase NifS [Fastidiosipila sp.]|nr:cysteine desulfurase NifS [Fastidiosipila sp.]
MTNQAESKSRVYFDHAATTAIHPEVMAVFSDALQNNFGNPSSFYKEGNLASRAMNQARASIAEILEVKPEEIFFTSGGTEADNWAIKGAALAQSKKGKHLITSAIEHHAVLHSMQALEKQGFEVTYLKVDADGLVDTEDLRAAIRPDTTLVSIMYANNEIGTIQPIKELGDICRENKVLFHCDAVQALGAIPLRPKDLGVDFMSFSGHKLYGPKGIGILYKRRAARLAQLIDGGAQERNQRGGTENVPSIIAVAKAVELAYSDMEHESKRQIRLRDRLISEIPKIISYAKLNGHPNKRLPNNVNFSFEFIEGESILLLLDAFGYACSSGSACTSASLDPSHVLLGIGLPHEVAHGSLRISLGRENTDDDIDRFLQDLPKVIQRLRDMSPLYDDFKNNKIEALIPREGGNRLVREGGYGI